ncbi:hypothetical protein GTA08_BOTSDO13094 [Neofusicoccum parvum]|uniref:Uncharacterized protein n=1 Tax=Neofusicoccum parvum TaxID=310453 RepID=A0ACB5SDY0_9PEZI|nr:hypothetical protein GTA08_BOTSDO13094 [Neofusicoccum parvum]
MPPTKRSATPDAHHAPLAKKPKVAEPPGSFPNFDDGDVAISVGDLELNLHSRTLRDTCAYFAEFDSTGFPKHFIYQPRSPSLGHDADQTMTFAVVSPYRNSSGAEAANDDDNSTAQTTTTTTTTTDARMKRAKAANEAVFRILYRQPFSCARPADFRDAATLATRYGCADAVRDALVTAILKASLGTTLFQSDPWALLDAAYNLRDESIFSEALLHAVGRGGGDELLPDAVVDLMDKHVADLEAKVKRCWHDAMRCCRTDSIPRALAATLMRSYLDQHTACALGSPLRPEVYRVLAALHHMDNVKPLLQARLMAMVDEVDNALVAGQDFVNAQDPDRCYDGESHSNTIYVIDKGLGQCVNVQSVEGELLSMLKGIKEAIKPLFVGDRNVGYFTCTHFPGPFPCLNAPPSSP